MDPGVGMMWKHVQVNGYWTWQAVASGGGFVKLPYDCHAGLTHRSTGWSPGKKTWCCQHKQIGCMDVSAGAAAGAGAAAAGAAGAHPPGVAGHGMMWKHTMSGGQWHWEQHHIAGHMDMAHMHDCSAPHALPADQKDFCCKFFGRGC